MTKKERVLAAINGENQDGIPSSFSLHFPKEIDATEKIVDAHLKFFKDTDTDILKIMNENLVPYMGEINEASQYDWVKDVSIDAKFMQDQIEITKRILDKCDPEAFKIGTLHGITASAIHPLEKMKQKFDYDSVRLHHKMLLEENPKPVLEGMKRICDGMCQLAQKYIDCGLDGVYYAALGGETRFFSDEQFKEWIEPFDKMIMSAIKQAGGFCFLHICKDGLDMNRYADYNDYCDVVNWGVYEAPFSIDEGKKLFPNTTIMGGLKNRSGVLVDGTKSDVVEETKRVIASYDKNGDKGFILGADCTLATEQDLTLVRAAVKTARSYK